MCSSVQSADCENLTRHVHLSWSMIGEAAGCSAEDRRADTGRTLTYNEYGHVALCTMAVMSASSPRAPYIDEDHVIMAPLLRKASPALTLQLWDRSPSPGIPRCSDSITKTEHRQGTMDSGSSGISLLLFKKVNNEEEETLSM